MAYIASPIVLTLLVITIVSVIIGLRQAKSIRAEGEVESGSKRAPMTFLLVMIGFVCFALYNTATIPDYAFVGYFPGHHRNSDPGVGWFCLCRCA